VKTESQIIAEIAEQLSTKDSAKRLQAIAAIRDRMQNRGLSELRQNWLRRMMEMKLHQEAADLALEGILLAPSDTKSLENVLQYRIKALLVLGKAPEGLSAAKGLFNVSTMAGTSDAILSVAECLNAAWPQDKEILGKFRDEQIAGSAPPKEAPLTSSVLAGIKVDAAAYDEALKRLTGEDAASLMARGNLLLLADRPKEAMVVFDRMYTLTTADLIEASEARARCLKAEDGTIGRANAWVLSLRPKTPESTGGPLRIRG
jgi:tetratricopeptide (TPR) repeat protein